MSSEQVAGILRQCPQQVRLVVARSVREPTTTDTPPSMSQRTSITSEAQIKATNNIVPSSTTPSLSMLTDNDGIINSSQNKILLRTERLLESNHNFEKLLENLREQVHFYFSIDIINQEEKKRERLIIFKTENRCECVTSFSLPSNTYIYFSLFFGIFSFFSPSILQIPWALSSLHPSSFSSTSRLKSLYTEHNHNRLL
jgi:hypothetical protein